MGLLTLPVLNQAGHLVALGPSDVCPAQLPPGWLPGVHVLLAQTLWHLQPAPEHYLPSLVISKYLLSCRPEEKAPSGMRRGCRGTRGGSPLPRRVWLRLREPSLAQVGSWTRWPWAQVRPTAGLAEGPPGPRPRLPGPPGCSFWGR